MTRAKLEFLDYGKGFAILSIMSLHFCSPYTSGLISKAILLGGTGVHLFFVISGFGLSLSGRTLAPSDFYYRRIRKILIPYFLIVTCIFFTNFFTHIYPRDGFYAYGGHIFLYKMFDESIVTSFGYHFWYISTIVQFYLIFPILNFAKQRLGGNLFALLALSVSLT